MYKPLIDELQRSTKWWHYLNSTWLVVRYETLVEFAPLLRSHLVTADRMLIVPAKGPADGWLPQDAWQWIRENVRNEW
jgi:hypothetical protein